MSASPPFSLPPFPPSFPPSLSHSFFSSTEICSSIEECESQARRCEDGVESRGVREEGRERDRRQRKDREQKRIEADHEH
eukprot:2874986-Rhodomonas_salina.1